MTRAPGTLFIAAAFAGSLGCSLLAPSRDELQSGSRLGRLGRRRHALGGRRTRLEHRGGHGGHLLDGSGRRRTDLRRRVGDRQGRLDAPARRRRDRTILSASPSATSTCSGQRRHHLAGRDARREDPGCSAAGRRNFHGARARHRRRDLQRRVGRSLVGQGVRDATPIRNLGPTDERGVTRVALNERPELRVPRQPERPAPSFASASLRTAVARGRYPLSMRKPVAIAILGDTGTGSRAARPGPTGDIGTAGLQRRQPRGPRHRDRDVGPDGGGPRPGSTGRQERRSSAFRCRAAREE